MEPVTVWWGLPSRLPERLAGLLDPVERDRRDRYLRREDRDRFTLGVVTTRLVVAERLGIAPEQVPLTRDCADCGKPHGPPVVKGHPLHLSVSHSGDRVGVAVSPHGPVGVDVEEDGGRMSSDIARHLLGPGEEGEGQDELLAYWTRKEALLKTTGDGLRVPLSHVRVSPPHEKPRLLSWEGRPNLPDRFTLCTLHPGDGYAACLALLDHPGDDVVQRRAEEIF